MKTLLEQWYEASELLAKYKEEELKLRNAVIAEEFNYDANDIERKGTENKDLGGGFKLKAVFKVATKINEPDVFFSAMDFAKERFPEASLMIDSCLKTKYEFSESQYKELPEAIQEILNEGLVSKPAQPTISIVKPKR